MKAKLWNTVLDKANAARDHPSDHLPPPCRRLVYDELQGKAKERAAKEEKRRKQAREDLAYLLRHMPEIDADTTWAQAEELLQSQPKAPKQVRGMVQSGMKVGGLSRGVVTNVGGGAECIQG